MLSRRITSAALTGLPAGTARGFQAVGNQSPDTTGSPAHPDLFMGVGSKNYRGRGWVSFNKQLPGELIGGHVGDNMTMMNDRHGHVQDPEDPRHPMVRAQFGCDSWRGLDNSVNAMVNAKYGPIPKSSRLLQVLYNNYLEPFSMQRTVVPLLHHHKIPNNGEQLAYDSIAYIGQTSNLIGNVYIGLGSTVMEGCTLRADTNQIIIHEGCQIMENVSIIADAPTTLHHYQRGEQFNPYQTLEAAEGVVKIGMNTIVEPNCHIEACNLGTFGRIGHGTTVMKGVTGSIFNHVLPGSVLLPDTHMNEGEVWGGAPARKIGKVSKFEYKRPWFASIHHRDQTIQAKDVFSQYGDQIVLWSEEMGKLDALMLQFEDGLSPGVKAQMQEFIEGREPYGHMIARMTQAWTPANRSDDKCNDHRTPAICWNSHRNHNDDSESEYTGHIFNWKGWLNGGERRW